jgi:hypothetical protein
MTAPNRTPEIGPVSSDTLRPEDLIPTFLDALTRYAPARAEALAAEHRLVLEAMNADNFDTFYEEDDDIAEAAGWLLDELSLALDDIAPPYVMFGTSEGDGACFGFWPALDSLEEDARAGDDVVKLPAGIRWEWNARNGRVTYWQRDGAPPESAAASFVFEVNDHGNATLYDARTMSEIWSLV